MLDFGVFGNETEKRLICKESEFEAWQSGEKIYLVKDECFAGYQIERISDAEYEDLRFASGKLTLEQGRYKYIEAHYNEKMPDGEPFETLSDEEIIKYYLSDVIAERIPVYYEDWARDGRNCYEYLLHDVNLIVSFTMYLPAVIRNGKTEEREAEE